jgi:hypothetical protein
VLPWHFLAHHPRDDVDRADRRRFRAVTAAATAFRAADLVGWHGFDPVFANGLEDVDLCLRALDDRPGGYFAVVPESVVVHHESKAPGRDDARVENRRLFDERWRGRYPESDAASYEAAGLQLVGLEPGEPRGHDTMARSSRPLVTRPPRLVDEGPWSGRPALRWALKTDRSDPDAAAAASLLRGHLEHRGQEVVVDDIATFYRASCGLDDVAVLVSGASTPRFVPQPGAVNVLWFRAGSEVDDLLAASFVLHAGSGSTSARGLTGPDERIATVLDAMVGAPDHVGAAQTVAE